MKKYRNTHTGHVKTKLQWLVQFNKAREYGDLEAKETFDLFVRNGDLEEV